MTLPSSYLKHLLINFIICVHVLYSRSSLETEFAPSNNAAPLDISTRVMVGLGVFVAIAIVAGCLVWLALKKKRRREEMQFLELKKRNCMYCRIFREYTIFVLLN